MLRVELALFAVFAPAKASLESGHCQLGKFRGEPRFDIGEHDVGDKITQFAGSLSFVYLHIGWFTLWVLLNVGLIGSGRAFDKYPFGLLTLIVSLEAIFLSTFVMVSQNRQAARSDIRSDLDFENNLRSEIWSVHIGQALGLDSEHVETVVRAAIAGYRADSGAAATKAQPAS